jgi:hypothetical protein
MGGKAEDEREEQGKDESQRRHFCLLARRDRSVRQC